MLRESPNDDSEVAAVIAFWRAAGPKRWFEKDPSFDAEFRDRFLRLHFAAARRERDHWMETPGGALSLLLLLDQFPRNAFRGTAHMYATDSLARMVARRAIEAGFDSKIQGDIRKFFYLPFAHSESIEDQVRSLKLSRGVPGSYARSVRRHFQIIQCFGRFPHRNAVLGRETTTAEAVFLAAGGFAG
jgi:uncharacterized protein (DUF924 family)